MPLQQVSPISAIVSDHYQCRGYTVIFFSLLKIAGFVMFYGMSKPFMRERYLSDELIYSVSKSSHIRYASLFFSVTGTTCVAPALIAWLTNSAPHTRRATAVAVTSIMSELGGISATWLLGSLSPGPNYTLATITFIVMSIATVLFAAANLAYLGRENRLKAEKRQSMKKEDEPENLGDSSAWFVYNL